MVFLSNFALSIAISNICDISIPAASSINTNFMPANHIDIMDKPSAPSVLVDANYWIYMCQSWYFLHTVWLYLQWSLLQHYVAFIICAVVPVSVSITHPDDAAGLPVHGEHLENQIWRTCCHGLSCHVRIYQLPCGYTSRIRLDSTLGYTHHDITRLI